MSYRIVSVSGNLEVGRWQAMLERGGYTVISANSAADAVVEIHAGGIDAIFLGAEISIDDRTSLSLLGYGHGILVICMCGLRGEEGCPIVHLSPSQPEELLRILDGQFKMDSGCSRAA